MLEPNKKVRHLKSFLILLILIPIAITPAYAVGLGDMVTSVLGWIIQAIANLALGILEIIANLFLNVMNVDLSTLTTSGFLSGFEFFTTGIILVAVALGCMATLWQVFTVMVGPAIGIKQTQSTGSIVSRALIFIPLAYIIQDLALDLLSLFQGIYNGFLSAYNTGMGSGNISMGAIINPDTFLTDMGVNTTGLIESSLTVVAGTVIACAFSIGIVWNLLKLLLEMTQRFVILIVYAYLSPLAAACGVGAGSMSITKQALTVFFSSSVLWLLNVWTVGISLHLISLGGTAAAAGAGSFFIWGAFTYAFLRIAQQIDDVFSAVGANNVRLSGNVLDDLFAVDRIANYMKGAAHNIAAGYKNYRSGLMGTIDKYSAGNSPNSPASAVEGKIPNTNAGKAPATGAAVAGMAAGAAATTAAATAGASAAATKPEAAGDKMVKPQDAVKDGQGAALPKEQLGPDGKPITAVSAKNADNPDNLAKPTATDGVTMATPVKDGQEAKPAGPQNMQGGAIQKDVTTDVPKKAATPSNLVTKPDGAIPRGFGQKADDFVAAALMNSTPGLQARAALAVGGHAIRKGKEAMGDHNLAQFNKPTNAVYGAINQDAILSQNSAARKTVTGYTDGQKMRKVAASHPEYLNDDRLKENIGKSMNLADNQRIDSLSVDEKGRLNAVVATKDAATGQERLDTISDVGGKITDGNYNNENLAARALPQINEADASTAGNYIENAELKNTAWDNMPNDLSGDEVMGIKRDIPSAESDFAVNPNEAGIAYTSYGKHGKQDEVATITKTPDGDGFVEGSTDKYSTFNIKAPGGPEEGVSFIAPSNMTAGEAAQVIAGTASPEVMEKYNSIPEQNTPIGVGRIQSVLGMDMQQGASAVPASAIPDAQKNADIANAARTGHSLDSEVSMRYYKNGSDTSGEPDGNLSFRRVSAGIDENSTDKWYVSTKDPATGEETAVGLVDVPSGTTPDTIAKNIMSSDAPEYAEIRDISGMEKYGTSDITPDTGIVSGGVETLNPETAPGQTGNFSYDNHGANEVGPSVSADDSGVSMGGGQSVQDPVDGVSIQQPEFFDVQATGQTETGSVMSPDAADVMTPDNVVMNTPEGDYSKVDISQNDIVSGGMDGEKPNIDIPVSDIPDFDAAVAAGAIGGAVVGGAVASDVDMSGPVQSNVDMSTPVQPSGQDIDGGSGINVVPNYSDAQGPDDSFVQTVDSNNFSGIEAVQNGAVQPAETVVAPEAVQSSDVNSGVSYETGNAQSVDYDNPVHQSGEFAPNSHSDDVRIDTPSNHDGYAEDMSAPAGTARYSEGGASMDDGYSGRPIESSMESETFVGSQPAAPSGVNYGPSEAINTDTPVVGSNIETPVATEISSGEQTIISGGGVSYESSNPVRTEESVDAGYIHNPSVVANEPAYNGSAPHTEASVSAHDNVHGSYVEMPTTSESGFEQPSDGPVVRGNDNVADTYVETPVATEVRSSGNDTVVSGSGNYDSRNDGYIRSADGGFESAFEEAPVEHQSGSYEHHSGGYTRDNSFDGAFDDVPNSRESSSDTRSSTTSVQEKDFTSADNSYNESATDTTSRSESNSGHYETHYNDTSFGFGRTEIGENWTDSPNSTINLGNGVTAVRTESDVLVKTVVRGEETETSADRWTVYDKDKNVITTVNETPGTGARQVADTILKGGYPEHIAAREAAGVTPDNHSAYITPPKGSGRDRNNDHSDLESLMRKVDEMKKNRKKVFNSADNPISAEGKDS